MQKLIALWLGLLLAGCGTATQLPPVDEVDMATARDGLAADLAPPADMTTAPDLSRWPPECGVDGELCCDIGPKCREELATTPLYCTPPTLDNRRGRCAPCGIVDTPCCVGRNVGGNDGCRPGLGCGTKNGAPTCLSP